MVLKIILEVVDLHLGSTTFALVTGLAKAASEYHKQTALD
jgi:hypothetical protein